MTQHDARSEAEWILETIIDDFALSMDESERAQFYVRLVELLIRRRDQAKGILADDDSGPDSSGPVH